MTASRDKRRASSNQQDEISEPSLPMDIWCHIHSLLPMRDAARVACVSQAFAHSWRCHPNLTFSEDTFGLDENTCQEDKIMRCFTNKVDQILKHHSGIGVKTFNLQVYSVYDEKDNCHLLRLDSWLQIVVKRGIEELVLNPLGMMGAKYNFPCSLFSDDAGELLQHLSLTVCEFHPTIKIGCLKSLTTLQLHIVHIEDGELECILASSFTLEKLDLMYCSEIIFLKIPCLQWLSCLEVSTCSKLKAIESKAPNLSSFRFAGDLHVKLSLGKALKIKELYRQCKDAAYYARTELPSRMPNLERLSIYSQTEAVNAPTLPSKFLHLKYLVIALDRMDYDFLSLVSFFDASPSLETFTLDVIPGLREPVSIFDDPSAPRMMTEHHQNKLKSVHINNFSSARTLVELTCHIVVSTKSLECLTLDTNKGWPKCSDDEETDSCFLMSEAALAEAERALSAVQTYIKPKVSSTVELNVLEPCSQCHADEEL
ncbi:unnamed protein product [Urochloa decumbens]|uniref:At1g61320/AtMIF1 LRR domain-containing protein n=1 Tax=Urochloa decumbens TaxID=240449 RepID=A0ABC9EC87_9POAL